MAAIRFTDARRPASAVLPTPLVLLLLTAVAASGLSALSLLAPVPNTTDEALYIELARHLARTGGFAVLGVPFPVLTYAPLYDAFIAPVYWITASAQDAYVAIRELNAITFATASVPAFFIAIRVVSRRTALIVAAATIALPAGVYATKVMTESLAFAVVLWCVVAALRVAESSTLRRQSILLAAIAIATAVRFELLVLGLALAASCVFCGESRPRTQLRKLAPLFVGTIILTLGLVVLWRGTSTATAGAGAHGVVTTGFSVVRFSRILVGSIGALDLSSGVLPFGCLLLAALAVRRRAYWVRPGLRRLVLFTAASATALLLVSSAYLASVPAAFRPPIPSDRYTFYVVPLLLAVFAAWLEAGSVRARGAWSTAVVAGAAPLLAALLYLHAHPYGTFSGLAFLPWLALGLLHPLLTLAGLSLYCGWCAYLLASARPQETHTYVKPVVSVTSVVLLCAAAFFAASPNYSPPPGWLDTHTNGRVIAVWGVSPTPRRSATLGELMAANSRLAAVYFMRRPDSRGFDAVESRVREQTNGTLLDKRRPLAADFVLTDARTRIVGTLVAKRRGFAIYKVTSPVRIAPSRPIKRQKTEPG
jgi:hypothetical protein